MQGDNDRSKKTPGEPGAKQGQSKQDPAKSPSNSAKQSDSQSNTAGDRAGGGKEGGGQEAKKSGTGSEGTHTPSDEGSSTANEKGNGEIGPKAGSQAKSDHATGNAAKQTDKNGPGREGPQSAGKGPGGKQESQPDTSQTAESKEDESGGTQPGDKDSDKDGAKSAGNPMVGGRPGHMPDGPGPAAPKQPGADAANLDYARKQTDLALEHLRDQMARDKSNLLDELGWSREDGERFLQRWEEMKRAAGQEGPNGQAAKKSLDEAIKSLGLRPHGTQLTGEREHTTSFAASTTPAASSRPPTGPSRSANTPAASPAEGNDGKG